MSKKKLSRRALFRGLGVAAGGVIAGSETAMSSQIERTMSVKGHVLWSDSRWGFFMFRPERADALDVVIHLALKARHYGDEADRKVRELLAKNVPVTVTFQWRPEENVLSPWQPHEVICPNGEHLETAARPERAEVHLTGEDRRDAERRRHAAEKADLRAYHLSMSDGRLFHA